MKILFSGSEDTFDEKTTEVDEGNGEVMEVEKQDCQSEPVFY